MQSLSYYFFAILMTGCCCIANAADVASFLYSQKMASNSVQLSLLAMGKNFYTLSYIKTEEERKDMEPSTSFNLGVSIEDGMLRVSNRWDIVAVKNSVATGVTSGADQLPFYTNKKVTSISPKESPSVKTSLGDVIKSWVVTFDDGTKSVLDFVVVTAKTPDSMMQILAKAGIENFKRRPSKVRLKYFE